MRGRRRCCCVDPAIELVNRRCAPCSLSLVVAAHTHSVCAARLRLQIGRRRLTPPCRRRSELAGGQRHHLVRVLLQVATQPWQLQDRIDRWTLPRSGLQHGVHQGTHGAAAARRKARRAVQDLGHHCGQACALEGAPHSDHFVQKTTQGPDIALLAARLAVAHLCMRTGL